MSVPYRMLVRFALTSVWGATAGIAVVGYAWQLIAFEAAATVLMVSVAGVGLVGGRWLHNYRRAEQARRQVADRAAMKEPTVVLPILLQARPAPEQFPLPSGGLYAVPTVLDDTPMAFVDAHLSEQTGDVPRPSRGSTRGSTTPNYRAPNQATRQGQTPWSGGLERGSA